MSVDLSDTTFIFTVLAEHDDRVRNAHLVLSYLKSRLNTNFIITEATKDWNPKLLTLCKDLGIQRYIHQQLAPGEEYWRTRTINEMLRTVQTPYVCNHDIDVVLEEATYQFAIDRLRKNVLDVVYPFSYGNNQVKINVTWDDYESWKKENFVGLVEERFKDRIVERNISSCGHLQILKTQVYRACYGEHQGFTRWGIEDVVRWTKFKRFGYRVSWLGQENQKVWTQSSKYQVFHFEHFRGPDSSTNNPNYAFGLKLHKALDKLNSQEMRDYYKKLHEQGWCY